MEEKNDLEEKKVMPVHVFGSDEVLTEPEDIAYYKAQLQEFGAINRLLGEIDDDGEYVITEAIREDLAALPKELLREDGDTIDATSRLMAKDMYFTIELDQDGEIQIASLYLTEMVQGYGDIKSIRTFVAKFEQPDQEGFGQKAKKAFNVQDVLMDIPEGEYINLVMRIQDQIDYALCLEDIIDLASQIYVLRVLALLETKGEKGQEIIRQYNREVKDRGLNKPDVRHRYTQLRKILDNTIENAGGEKEIFADKQDEIKDIKKEFAQSVQKVEAFRGKNLAGAIKEAKKEEKKAEPKVDVPKKQAKKAGKVISVGVGKAAGGKAGKSKKKEEKQESKKAAGGGGGGTATPRAPKLEDAEPTLKDKIDEPPVAPAPAPIRPKVIERTPPKEEAEEEIPLAERLLNRELGGQHLGPTAPTPEANTAPAENGLNLNSETPPIRPTDYELE